MKSDNLNELFGALSKAQASIKGAIKDAQNPFFKSQYTTLDACWDACRGPLSANGLTVIQIVEESDEKQRLVTILGHSSGQFITSSIPLLLAKQDPQSLGSCLSYMRRYALCAIVGITQSDDDGETVQETYREEYKKPKMTVDTFFDLINKKTQGLYSFDLLEEYLVKLEHEKGVPLEKIMEQALNPALTERFCKGWEVWYKSLNKS